MTRTPAPLLTAATAILVMAGCDSNPVASLPDITGTYTLVSVDGEPLPAILYEDDEIRFELVSGTLILSASDTYSEPVTLRVTDKVSDVSETAVETDTGSFTVTSATSVTFTSSDPEIGSYTATISGNELTYTFGGSLVTYRR